MQVFLESKSPTLDLNVYGLILSAWQPPSAATETAYTSALGAEDDKGWRILSVADVFAVNLVGLEKVDWLKVKMGEWNTPSLFCIAGCLRSQ